MQYSDEIQIRSLHSIEELEQVRNLESKIWGAHDSVPTHQTITAVKNGGLVLGAYNCEQLVGFQYSFPGFDGNSSYLCSHILGIDQDFRNQKIAEKLKLAQRAEALKLGYSLITWTYDPLESINGYLNIAKLGGVCSTYVENCYGEMEDLLNGGLASDRFLVEWHIGQDYKGSIGQEINQNRIIDKSLINWRYNKEGMPIPSRTLPLPQEECDTTYVAIPKDFRIIKETDMQIATKWRLETRAVFNSLFQKGWKVTGFIKNSMTNLPVHFYELTKKR
jgi:predicted GNAT superfamily acetyltransferase